MSNFNDCRPRPYPHFFGLANVFLITLISGIQVFGAERNPCRSGPQPGERTGPYSALISTGPQRGQQHCFICETGDRPAIIVFARGLTPELAKLIQKLDALVAEHQKADLRSWVTFLNDNQTEFDPQIVAWGRKNAIRGISLGVFEDKNGPPSYRMADDADVTVLMCVKQRVVSNFSYRKGEFGKSEIEAIAKGVPKILPSAKK